MTEFVHTQKHGYTVGKGLSTGSTTRLYSGITYMVDVGLLVDVEVAVVMHGAISVTVLTGIRFVTEVVGEYWLQAVHGSSLEVVNHGPLEHVWRFSSTGSSSWARKRLYLGPQRMEVVTGGSKTVMVEVTVDFPRQSTSQR